MPRHSMRYPMADEVVERVQQLVAEILEIEVEEVEPDAKLVEELGADSMSGLELLATLEREFTIVIAPEHLPEFESVASTARLVRRLKGDP